MNVAQFLNLRVVALLILIYVSFCIFCSADKRTKFFDAHCNIVHFSWNGITHMLLLSSMMMQYIRTKQAEENWSLHKYNFLAVIRKTVPHACRSEDWIKIPTQTVEDFRPW